MKRKPKGASAPAFLVISADHPRYTNYTGTKDQIISLGLALDGDFPVAPQRIRYSYVPGQYGHDLDIKIRRIKGGCFELRKWHEERESRPWSPLKEFCIRKSSISNSGYEMTYPGVEADKKLKKELNKAALRILRVIHEAWGRGVKRKLSLVKPGQTMESFKPPFAERRAK